MVQKSKLMARMAFSLRLSFQLLASAGAVQPLIEVCREEPRGGITQLPRGDDGEGGSRGQQRSPGLLSLAGQDGDPQWGHLALPQGLRPLRVSKEVEIPTDMETT